ncbi:ATP-binding protein [Streptomyces sp.]|uniref:ATP-binding protein n=1 Tax=Streptomyces sp. TaxID=1931 RepID=UPI0028114675|nr:ATP-binding protein [Streptomyces sp.]
MSIWWSLHLRREAASVPLARRLLMGTMETAGVDPDVSYDLSVALTEACANAVEHGGGAGTGPGRGAASEAYRVTAYLDGETCRIEVADSGPGFPGVGRRPVAGLSGASGPATDGTLTDGSLSVGPATDGPATNGPATDGSAAADTATRGPAARGPVAGGGGPDGSGSGAPAALVGTVLGGPVLDGPPLGALALAEAESGRGLRLIEELADHVQFGNRSGLGGAVVSFDKILKWKDSPSLLLA